MHRRLVAGSTLLICALLGLIDPVLALGLVLGVTAS